MRMKKHTLRGEYISMYITNKNLLIRISKKLVKIIKKKFVEKMANRLEQVIHKEGYPNRKKYVRKVLSFTTN